VTVGYHAPPPGSRSGVADYAETLRTGLQQFGDVRTGAASAGIHLYHLGNNLLHKGIYRTALEKPGVIVLHDAVLHHFLLGTLTEDEYISEWVYNYGEWRRPTGEDLWRERTKASTDPRYFAFPMLRRIIEASRFVIVHNSGAADIVREHGAVRVEIIPHFCERIEVPSGADIAQFRERIGVGQGVRLFGIFGYLREPKRIAACIRAFRRLHAVKPETALLITGEVASSHLSRFIESEGHPAIRHLRHLDENNFMMAGAAVDCCLNLRYPGAGETSGIAVRMMGLGRPVIVTRSAENSDYPDGSVLRVSPGVAEAEELFDHMVLVTEFPGIARDIGIAAKQHVQRHHALDSVARRYWEVLCSAAASLPS
jgi:glycosyltransferase involved in cell wall biosynthesis